MIARIFRLSDKQASAMMTPRSETDWLDLDKSDEELNSVILASGRSRFPVAEKTSTTFWALSARSTWSVFS